MSSPLTPLSAISPVDGRYRDTTESLAEFFSEHALITYRVFVETEYLIALAEIEPKAPFTLSTEECKAIRSVQEVSLEDAGVVKAIETIGHGDIPATRHDVKAVEYVVNQRLETLGLGHFKTWVHFALTSEDVNNLSYALMLRDALEGEIIPTIEDIYAELDRLANAHAAVPMLARTHGQSASPTTFGKEMRVYAERLDRQLAQLRSISILAKLNGATGNYNAHCAAYPTVDWERFSEKCIASLNKGHQIQLAHNPITTQIEPHDTYVELFDIMRRTNTILIDCAQDMWRYISDGWVVQKPKEGEVGSSTMPHKVNPIDFENAEGNFGIANALFEHFARKLPISRLQRDLSDSTVERTFGVAFAHAYIGYKNLMRGFGKISVNEAMLAQSLADHPEVLAEAVQTILRREGMPDAYEAIKKISRGKPLTLETLAQFVGELPIDESVRSELLALTPEGYIGLAAKLARRGNM